MVFPARFGTDGRQRAADQVTAHVHGNLTGLDDLALAGLGQQGVAGNVEILADRLLHLVDGDIVFLFADNLAGYVLGQFDRNILMGEGRMGDQGDQRTLQFAEIRFDPGRQVDQHFIADLDAFAETAGAEHLEPGLVRRRLQLDGQAPFHAGKHPFLKVLQVGRSPVGGENQLLAVLVEMVEDIEEGILASGAEQVLDVIKADLNPRATCSIYDAFRILERKLSIGRRVLPGDQDIICRAFEQIKQEIVNMASIAIQNFNISIDMVKNLDFSRQNELDDNEKELNFLNKELVELIVRLGQSSKLNKKDTRYLSSSYKAIADLERVGDYAQNLSAYAKNLEGNAFDETISTEIERTRNLINKLFLVIIDLYKEDKHKVNKEIKDLRDSILSLSNLMVKKYIKRLNDNELTPISSGEYLKICNDTKRVSEHLINLIDTDYVLNH